MNPLRGVGGFVRSLFHSGEKVGKKEQVNDREKEISDLMNQVVGGHTVRDLVEMLDTNKVGRAWLNIKNEFRGKEKLNKATAIFWLNEAVKNDNKLFELISSHNKDIFQSYTDSRKGLKDLCKICRALREADPEGEHNDDVHAAVEVFTDRINILNKAIIRRQFNMKSHLDDYKKIDF